MQGGNLYNFRTASNPVIYDLKVIMTTLIRETDYGAVMPLALPAEGGRRHLQGGMEPRRVCR